MKAGTLGRICRGLGPVLVLGWMSFLSGTFPGEAVALWRIVGLLGLTTLALLGCGSWRDPLALGRLGGVVWVLWAWLMVSLHASSVARAGWTQVALLPLLLLAVPGVARSWRDPIARRWGQWGLGLLVGAACVHALVGRFVLGDERAAAPLGHHNLLMLWLLVLAPPAVLGLLGVRWLAVGLGAVAALTLVATGSLAGGVGAMTVAACLLWRSRGRLSRGAWRSLAAGIVAGGVVAVWLGPRLLSIASGHDASLASRFDYWRAGLHGLLERPVVGWGPGSSSWLASEHLSPAPGVRPAFEIVTDFHSLPIEVLFELGGIGFLLCSAIVVLLARTRRRDVEDRPPDASARGARAGLLGFAVAAIGSGCFDVTALPVAVAVVVGIVTPAGDRPRRLGGWLRSTWPGLLAVVGAWLLLVPDLRGHWHYDQWLARGERQDLLAANAADPSFPLYPLQLGGKLEAARLARGLAPFWLAAGSVDAVGLTSAADTPEGGERSFPERQDALARACELEPLDPVAPLLFVLGQSRPGAGPEVDSMARALAGEPRLAAVPAVSQRVDLPAVIGRIESVEEWPIGWRAELVRQLREVLQAPVPDASAELELVVELDRSPDTSLSLFAFRRQPRPGALARVVVRDDLVLQIQVPSLWSIPGVASPRWQAGCGGLAEPAG